MILDSWTCCGYFDAGVLGELLLVEVAHHGFSGNVGLAKASKPVSFSISSGLTWVALDGDDGVTPLDLAHDLDTGDPEDPEVVDDAVPQVGLVLQVHLGHAETAQLVEGRGDVQVSL